MKSGLVHAVESQILDFNILMEDLANKKTEVRNALMTTFYSIRGQKLLMRQEPRGSWPNSCNRRSHSQRRGHFT